MEDLTAKFKEIEKKSPTLLLKVKGKVYNLHGRGATRLQDIQEVVYSQVDTESSDRAGAISKATEARRTKTKAVNTFPKNGTGQIVAPVGGAYGYLMGALKTATAKYGGDRAKRASPAYGLKRKITEGLFIEPADIELGKTFSNPPESPVSHFITKIGVSEYYDVVAEAPVEFTIRVENDVKEDMLLELLAFVQRVGLGPKRRGLLKIDKVERLN